MVSCLSMCSMIASISSRLVAEIDERGSHRLVDDLEHAAAGEQLVFDQRDVGLDAGGIAIHEEPDGAGGREDGDLGIAVAVLSAERERAVPAADGLLLEEGETLAGLDACDVRAVQLDDFEHRLDVGPSPAASRRRWPGNPCSPGTAPCGGPCVRSAHRRGRS